MCFAKLQKYPVSTDAEVSVNSWAVNEPDLIKNRTSLWVSLSIGFIAVSMSVSAWMK